MMIPRDKPIPALLELIAAWVPDLSPKHRIDAASIPQFIPPPLRAIYEFADNYDPFQNNATLILADNTVYNMRW
jgi:hypothetical protein